MAEPVPCFCEWAPAAGGKCEGQMLDGQGKGLRR